MKHIYAPGPLPWTLLAAWNVLSLDNETTFLYTFFGCLLRCHLIKKPIHTPLSKIKSSNHYFLFSSPYLFFFKAYHQKYYIPIYSKSLSPVEFMGAEIQSVLFTAVLPTRCRFSIMVCGIHKWISE